MTIKTYQDHPFNVRHTYAMYDSHESSLLENTFLPDYCCLTSADLKWPLTSTNNFRDLLHNMDHQHAKYAIPHNYPPGNIIFTRKSHINIHTHTHNITITASFGLCQGIKHNFVTCTFSSGQLAHTIFHQVTPPRTIPSWRFVLGLFPPQASTLKVVWVKIVLVRNCMLGNCPRIYSWHELSQGSCPWTKQNLGPWSRLDNPALVHQCPTPWAFWRTLLLYYWE